MARVSIIHDLRLPDGRALGLRRRDGGEPALVVLHGLLDSAEGWTPVLDATGGSAIAFDLPGFGHSDPPPRGSITGYADDVAAALDLLGVRQFTLLGHSLGGAVATALAERCAERVTALVLLAPAGFGRIPLAEAVSIPGLRNLVRAALPVALSNRFAVAAAYRTMVVAGLSAPQRDIVDRVIARGSDLVVGAREGTRAVVTAGRAPDAFHRRTVAYGGPVFAVWGEHDRLVPPGHAAGVRAALPQASIEIWPGMGHHPLVERFDELLGLIRQAMSAGAGHSRASRRTGQSRAAAA
jgi:pimeloyl-ACP methyl ester carboxylesterase